MVLRRVPRTDPLIVALADRHYSRQKPCRQVGSPTRLIVLRDDDGSVGFVWGWPREGYRADGQDGANCELFRNESATRSSDLILAAEAIVLDTWPVRRFFTYVDPNRIRSPNPGYCFLVAGWRRAGYSRDGKHLLVKDLPQVAGVERRARPRKRSWRMRRLRWVMLREATVCVHRIIGMTDADEAQLRALLRRQDTARVERHLGVLLARYPYARCYPAIPSLTDDERRLLRQLRAEQDLSR